MPEGDTLHRTAAALRAALHGRTLVGVELPRCRPPYPAVGSTVDAVEARGKHLLVATSDGLVLHTHLGMTGAWHLYSPGEPWRRARAGTRALLRVEGRVAVCFGASVVEVLDAPALTRHPVLRRLGPDLCEPSVDVTAVVRRLESFGSDTTIGEALLDQRIACGVGNVYRCEVLFLHGVDPATPVDVLPRATRSALLAEAARLLRANLETSRRTTVDAAEGSLWVHGRGGRPCRRCGTPIEVRPLGEQARLVYRCPACQSAWQLRRRTPSGDDADGSTSDGLRAVQG